MKNGLVMAMLATTIVAGSVFAQSNLRTPNSRVKNYVHNGSFDNAEKPLDGWMIDYKWTKNSHYMQNHTRISHLSSYKGRRNVMFVNGASAETKVESKPFEFERDARYKVSIDHTGSTNPHMYLMGYQWAPGVRPHKDPHIGDLRPRYKSTWRGHKVTNLGGGWKRSEFDVPMEKMSSLAKKHLKPVRFFTVYIIVVDTGKGTAYIDDVKVTRIK